MLKIDRIGSRIKVTEYRARSGWRQERDQVRCALEQATVESYCATINGQPLTPEQRAEYVRSAGSILLQEARAAREAGKLPEALSRARRRVFEGVACNDWQFFCTLTISPDLAAARGLQRSGTLDDLRSWWDCFSQWLRNRRRLYGCAYRYILVPELHADRQGWHLHGVVSGIPAAEVGAFPPTAPKALTDGGYQNWTPYGEAWGFCSLAPIRDKDRCASYMTKYVTKDMGAAVRQHGAHLYYGSRGLQGAEILAKGCGELPEGWEWDYEGEYARVRWLPAELADTAVAWITEGDGREPDRQDDK